MQFFWEKTVRCDFDYDAMRLPSLFFTLFNEIAEISQQCFRLCGAIMANWASLFLLAYTVIHRMVYVFVFIVCFLWSKTSLINRLCIFIFVYLCICSLLLYLSSCTG